MRAFDIIIDMSDLSIECTGSYDMIHFRSFKNYERKVFWKTYDNIRIRSAKNKIHCSLRFLGGIINGESKTQSEDT